MDEQTKSRLIRAHVYIAGFVQGVYFRAYTRRKAQSLGLTGWVRNLRDGRVEAVFEGEETAVREAVAWCHRGSPSAHVESVEVTYSPPTGEYTDFRVTW
ncbi:MAG: acylphosphatase [Caldilineae bacterium]|nr:MAG: acylphosphatase [Caldilineae bacterium]